MEHKYLKKLGLSFLSFFIISLLITPLLPKGYENYISFIAPCIILFVLIFIYYNELKEDFNKLNKGNIKNAFKIYISGLTIFFIYNIIKNYFFDSMMPLNEEFVRNFFKGNFLIASVFSIFIAPVYEEILFRLSIYKATKNKKVFLVLSSTLFALLHISNIMVISELVNVIGYLILSFTISYSLYKEDNIWASITLHIFHNFLMALILYLGELI